MDIVQTIMNMCSGPVTSKLSSLLGEDEATTKTAVSTAVPTLLAGMGQMASTQSGAQRLVATMDQFGEGGGGLSNILSDDPNSVAEQGGSLLKSLFGGSGLSGLGSQLSRFSGIGGGSATKLLSFLGPLVMAGIAKQFSGGGLSPSSLMNFFADQRSNIARALPSGFSLSGLPGLSGATGMAETAYDQGTRGARAVGRETATAASSAARWAVPVLVGLAILGAVLYFATRHRGEAPTVPPAQVRMPETTQIRDDISGTITSIQDSLSGITDSTTANKALPKLRELDTKLDTVKDRTDQLPASAKSTISSYTNSSMASLVDKMNSTLSSPGVPEQIRPVCESIVSKLSNIAGVPRSQYTLAPTPGAPTAREEP